jgi:hypothetical protein
MAKGGKDVADKQCLNPILAGDRVAAAAVGLKMICAAWDASSFEHRIEPMLD